MIPTTFIMAGVIIAAAITALFNLTSLVVNKEQKTSEFRQLWVDSLREDLAKFLGLIETLVRLSDQRIDGANKEFTEEELEKFREDNKDSYFLLSEMKYRILLRLNWNEPEHKEIYSAIENIYDDFYGTSTDLDELKAAQDKLAKSSQLVIKSTWDSDVEISTTYAN